MTLHLSIGNKSYSSWSLRPWILLRTLGIPFEETVIPMYRPDTKAAMLAASPNGKVPALRDGDVLVSESIAILEYVAELFPERPVWPRDRAARALARAISAEMHAGFAPLRRACPTNFRRTPKPIPVSAEVRADVDRVEDLWADARARFGEGGPFLFGAFSAADAMYAPVVNRLHAYAMPVRPETRAYMEAVMALPAWRDWIAGAAEEPWHNAETDAL